LCGRSSESDCATLTAAKILGETAGVERFRSRHAYARHNGKPVPVWSGNRERHRLSRIENRQLSTALHRIAITQLATTRPHEFLQCRRTSGDTKTESIRALKRRLSDVVYRALLAERRTLSAAGNDHRGGLTEEQGDTTRSSCLQAQLLPQPQYGRAIFSGSLQPRRGVGGRSGLGAHRPHTEGAVAAEIA
jgi:Transposase IS116/IS110/IS902 family